MKNSNDTTGNLTRDLPACSAVRSERFRHCKLGLRRLPAPTTVSCPDFYTFINGSHSVVTVMVTCSALFLSSHLPLLRLLCYVNVILITVLLIVAFTLMR